MASRFSKAPTFVSTVEEDLSVINRYDKEIQRINTDYNTADKQISDFKSKIDILKGVDKQYFDAKYNESIKSFSTGIDLTKRGEISKVEGLLKDIVDDPIITGAISSTANIKKVMQMRAEIKSNPKYMKNHRDSDEFAEQTMINDYLSSGKLGDNFTLKGPIITLDSSPLIDETIKKTTYDEKSTNFGPVNVLEKNKTASKISNNVYQTLGSNPAAIAGLKNDFNYQYKTPEAKRAYATSLVANKEALNGSLKKNIDAINTQMAAAIKAGNVNPTNLVNMQREVESLQSQLKSNYNINPEDDSSIFNAYLAEKAYNAGAKGEERAPVKVELDKYTSYFDTRKDKDRVFALSLDNFKQRQYEFEKNYAQRAEKLAIDKAGNSTDIGQNGVSSTYDAEQTVTFNKDADPIKTLGDTQKSLVETNAKLGKEIIEAIYETPGTPLNNLYKKALSKGINLTPKNGLFGEKAIQTLMDFQAELIKNSGGEMTPELQTLTDNIKSIRKNNMEHRTNDLLAKQALKDSGFLDVLNSKKGTNNLYGYFIDNPLSIVGSFNGPEHNKYLELMKGVTQSQNSFKEININGLNKNYDSEKTKQLSAEQRGTLQSIIQRQGLVNSGGKRYGLATTAGEKTGIFGKDNVLSQEFMQQVDWDNSLHSVVPGTDKIRVKLKITPNKKGTVVGIDEFKDGYAYVDVPYQFADELTSRTGKPLRDYFAQSDFYTGLNARNLSTNQKNKILGNGILDIASINLGGNIYHYDIKAKDDNKYFIEMNIGGQVVTANTLNPQRLLDNIEQASHQLRSKVKENKMSEADFNRELAVIVNELKSKTR